MKTWLFDIIEQFNIHDLIYYIKRDPFYILDNIFFSSILWLIAYWFVTTKKYGVYAFFKKVFFYFVRLGLKDKFKDDTFYVIGAFFFYGLAIYIFWYNITGMIPETLTITAFLELPAFLSFLFFTMGFFMALEQTKLSFIRGFFPGGVPAFVAPFLFLIEFISYCMRLFSLAVRLFINILAGHILLKIFSIIFLLFFYFCIYSVFELFAPVFFLWTLEFAFVMLEYVACMLQAIVLSSLVAIYLSQALEFYH